MKKSCLTVFHLDDNPSFTNVVKKILERTSELKTTFIVESFQASRDLLCSETTPDVVLLDYELSESDNTNGLDVAKECSVLWPKAVLVMLTCLEEESIIREALIKGTTIHDYLPKNVIPSLPILVENIHKITSSKFCLNNTVTLPKKPIPDLAGTTIIDLSRKIAPLLSGHESILIEGDKGVGKTTLISCLKCYFSFRIPELNCRDSSQLNSALSDLKRRMANGQECGWIILENIHVLDQVQQNALADLLWSRDSDYETKHLRLKVIATTDEPLSALVENNEFSSPLFSLLLSRIRIPPLAERPQEIESLVNYWLNLSYPVDTPMILKPTMECLKHYHWSDGNVNELFSTIKEMLNIRIGNLITPISLPEHIRFAKPVSTSSRFEKKTLPIEFDPTFQKSLDAYYYELISQLVLRTYHTLKAKKANLSVMSLSKHLHVSRTTLIGYMKEIKKMKLLSSEVINDLR